MEKDYTEDYQTKLQRSSSISVQSNRVIQTKTALTGYHTLTTVQDGALKNVKTKVQDTLSTQNDSGAATLSTAISAGTFAVKTFKAAQNSQPYFVMAGKNALKIAGNTAKLVKTADSTIGLVRTGVIKLDKDTMIFVKKMALHSKPIKTMRAVGIKTKRTYRVVKRSISNGTFIKTYVKGGAKIALKNGAKLTAKGTLRGLKGSYKGIKTGIKGVGNSLSNSDDMGAQALGLGINSTKYAVRGVKTSVKVGINTGKALIKTGKTVYKGGKSAVGLVKLYKRSGLKTAARWEKRQATRAIAKAGGSAVSAAIQAFKKLGAKIIFPLILIIIGVVIILSIISAPVAGVSAIFGGIMSVFTGDGSQPKDVNIQEYLTTRVETQKAALIQNIKDTRDNNLRKTGGKYDIVRLYAGYDTNEIELTDKAILNSLYSTSEYVAIIQPIYQTIMLTQYNLQPTAEQQESTFMEVWNIVTKTSTKELPTEYCYHATKPCSECGFYHADIATCPNYTSGKHDKYTCSKCCVREEQTSTTTTDGAYPFSALGTKTVKNPDGSTITTTTTETMRIETKHWFIDKCNGWYHCNGHKVLGVTITVGGYNELYAKYFTDEITKLENISNRTDEQQTRLAKLKDDYQLCQSYVEEAQKNINYADGSGDGSIDGVKFVGGIGNTAVVKTAETQIGNVGGQPYWSWYGFNGRVEWCACFVSWCEEQNGNIASGKVPKFCGCTQGVNWFKSKGRWASGGSSPVAGDIIFFDWDGSGLPQHVGIVVGCDGSKVYTIEGNSGDTCRRRSYPINSSVILGYGKPNY